MFDRNDKELQKWQNQLEFYKYVETDKDEKRREGYSIRWTMRTKATRCFYYGEKKTSSL